MHRERASWEKYRERLSAEAKEFEQMKIKFQEEKAFFDKEKRSEEWGREGLKSKLQASEELLAKERKEWLLACENDNKKMFATRTKITNLEAEIVSKNRDLASKDVEIAELKRRLFEAYEKNESLQIDLAAEKVKADTAEEARKAAEEARQISTLALNMAPTLYSEAQSIVDTLISEEALDQAVAELTDATRAVGHRGGYLECAQHVEEVLHQHFGTRHYFVTDQANEMLAQAEEVFDHLSLPVMELVTNALKHDDYVA
ncbi:hypothetical protein HanRHA438_Chr11g0501481 [Helianthus annuus]|uniref:Uncharacterized protein n=1 Tax=Helianthus annuus TaxID=4232 RepID=A0A9K3MZX9_HELAN|nr:hypothetical protein HanXRQr2_Chr11g0488661 [Helianthus annuus]KAJ0501399.1 hypothetical protein HanHA300_Chr11g0400371 [Helianthus annuus]KAJ0517307.1 hypothetical protein HanHA89_Chr11g0423891 [Helianthus annuus]KAJ0685318.1 hypothetical protein HanLR1_Chr11g0401341 [Helianthus annuus]KAJ0689223.1 hypothetical protein HanOQP8_Chr11g0403311 [Helianthus annuus]